MPWQLAFWETVYSFKMSDTKLRRFVEAVSYTHLDVYKRQVEQLVEEKEKLGAALQTRQEERRKARRFIN